MTMAGRFIDRGICALAMAALLLLVMFSPIRATITPRTNLPPGSPARNSSLQKIGHGDCQILVSGHLSLREADSFQPINIENALDADTEDEFDVFSPLACVSFDVLPSAHSQPYSEMVRVAIAPTVRPLRC